MINAEVIKGVQELLENHGVTQNQGERMGDYVARGLHISSAQAETLLASLHDGAEVDQAVAAAGIAPAAIDRDVLVRLAQVIGSVAGRVTGSLNTTD